MYELKVLIWIEMSICWLNFWKQSIFRSSSSLAPVFLCCNLCQWPTNRTRRRLWLRRRWSPARSIWRPAPANKFSAVSVSKPMVICFDFIWNKAFWCSFRGIQSWTAVLLSGWCCLLSGWTAVLLNKTDKISDFR